MNDKTIELSGISDLSANDHSVPTRGMWRQDGPFIMDGTRRKVAVMQGEPAEHEWHQRRILAADNAMHDTPTQFIEELVKNCQDIVMLGLITRDREMAATLKRMEESIPAHCREIEQLREMMDTYRAFEEQRAFHQQAPGSAEYDVTFGNRRNAS